MFDYRFTVVAPLSHGEPLAYSMAPRTSPYAREPVHQPTTACAELDNAHTSGGSWPFEGEPTEAPMRFGRHVTIAVPRTRRSD
jgi:hypothetical protein